MPFILDDTEVKTPVFSKLLAPQKEQLQAILAPVGLTLRQFSKPKNGLSGSVFILETDQSNIILKVFYDPAED